MEEKKEVAQIQENGPAEEETKQLGGGRYNYAKWRLDKPKEQGWSHELISCYYDQIKDKTSMDELLVLPEDGVDTLYKAFMANVEKMPNQPLLGTKGVKSYSWLTFAEAAKQAKFFACGCKEKGLVPEVEAEGRNYRFLGIQAKNRAEWGLAHLANMHNNCTTVALYDTLGVEASIYVIN